MKIVELPEILIFLGRNRSEVLKHFTLYFCLLKRFDKIEEPLVDCYKE